jgi:hypothetical protein
MTDKQNEVLQSSSPLSRPVILPIKTGRELGFLIKFFGSLTDAAQENGDYDTVNLVQTLLMRLVKEPWPDELKCDDPTCPVCHPTDDDDGHKLIAFPRTVGEA